MGILFSDNSFENLQFLTVEQTLADIANFIGAIKQAHNGFRSNVVVWGSRYGATLAAWARKRYPHLIDGALSSSGLFNLEAFSFTQYDLLEYTLLEVGNEVCHDQIRSVFETIHTLVLAGEGEYLQERFDLCEPVDTTNAGDIGNLIDSQVIAIVNYIQTRQ